MIKIYQAEWCPHSHKIRQRLTELGVPFIAIPVPAKNEDRKELIEVTGQDAIPAIILEDDSVLTGKDKHILAKLDELYSEPPTAEEHKQKAIKNSHKLGYKK